MLRQDENGECPHILSNGDCIYGPDCLCTLRRFVEDLRRVNDALEHKIKRLRRLHGLPDPELK